MTRRLILALALGVSLCAPAVAQMGQIPAFVTPAPASLSPVTLTYQMTANSSPTGSVDSFSLTFLSSLAANQRVAVSFSSSAPENAGPIVSAVFTPNVGSPVNSDPLICLGPDTNGVYDCLAAAVMPTGTTSATLTLTWSSTVFGVSHYAVYSLNNSALSSTTPTHAFVQSTTSPLSESIATPAGSGLIAYFFGFGVTTEAWTAGVTSDQGGFNFGIDVGHVSNAAASASYTVTNTWTVSGSGSPDLILWVYR